jgi:hypothetical protein
MSILPNRFRSDILVSLKLHQQNFTVPAFNFGAAEKQVMLCMGTLFNVY